ncbi:MAG TPA: hypothetical protein VK553_01655 [Candidatus Nitrosopolaris rasttigaisensis]|nr:hypothetical protein [Candidatus Nitrosopolaris rasttigaisensis]
MSNNMNFKIKMAPIPFPLFVPWRADGYGERRSQRQQQDYVEVIEQ